MAAVSGWSRRTTRRHRRPTRPGPPRQASSLPAWPASPPSTRRSSAASCRPGRGASPATRSTGCCRSAAADVARALVGTEGTCAIVARATVRLVRPPAARCLLVLGFADDIAGAEAVPALLTEGPFTVESLSAELLELAHASRDDVGLPAGGAWLLVEARGDVAAEAREHAARLADGHRPLARCAGRPPHHATRPEQAALWRIREDGAGHSSRLADGVAAWPGFEDSAVPPERLARLPARAARAAPRARPAGHQLRPLRRGLRPPAGRLRPGPRRWRGALPALHGGRGGPRRRPRRLAVRRARRRPRPRRAAGAPVQPAAAGRLRGLPRCSGIRPACSTPSIIVAPPPLTRGPARHGTALLLEVRPAQAYSHDGGDFRSAVERCIGVGRCVSTQGSELMCPSFRATRDEQHSTRGRARLLQEMVAGSLAEDGWALDGGARGTGPLPGLPRLRLAVPHERGHGHLQVGVPAPPLPAPAAAALALLAGLAAALAAARRPPRPLAGQRRHALAPDAARLHAGGRHRRRAGHPAPRPAPLHAGPQGASSGPARPTPPRRAHAAASCSGRTPSTTT